VIDQLLSVNEDLADDLAVGLRVAVPGVNEPVCGRWCDGPAG
jgi:hypothetical protein